MKLKSFFLNFYTIFRDKNKLVDSIINTSLTFIVLTRA